VSVLTSLIRDSLRQLSLSSLLAVLAVAIGAANIVALISVTDTGRQQMFSMLHDYGANTLFVFPYFEAGSTGFQRAGAFAFVPQNYTGVLRGMDELEAVAGVLMMPGHAGRGAERVFATIEGAEPDYPLIRGHGVTRGRYITDVDEDEHALVCCLGAAMVEPLFGEDDPLGSEVIIKGQRFTVVGVMIEKGLVGFEDVDRRVYIPLSTAQELYELEGTHAIMARVRADLAVDDVRELVEQRLREVEGLAADAAADFDVTSLEQLTGILDSALGVFRVLLVGVGSVALLVAGTGIMSVMLMQVIVRTREIGIRRAVGARRRDILAQFLAEAVLQTFAGAVLGSLLGLAASWIFCLIVGWQLHITAGTLALAALFSIATGIIFGVYPAISASRLHPIDCLRHE